MQQYLKMLQQNTNTTKLAINTSNKVYLLNWTLREAASKQFQTVELENLLTNLELVDQFITINIMTAYSPQKAMSPLITEDETRYSFNRSFKRIQRSSSRKSSRSLSREENVSMFKNFFVKNVCQEQLSANTQGRQSQQLHVKKKREPTPCKSRRLISQTAAQSPSETELQKVRKLENNIIIHNLEEQISKKQTQLVTLRIENKNQKIEIAALQKKNKQVQMENSKLSFQLRQSQHRIHKLEQSVLQGEENLASVKNNLQKIKKSIQQSRFNDMKKQNDILKKKVQELNNQIQVLGQNIKTRDSQLLGLQKENRLLRGKVESQQNIKNESMKENYLQNEVRKLKQHLQKSKQHANKQILESFEQSQLENSSLKEEVKKLTIQLNYIQRKHIEQFKILTKIKAQQLARIKKRFKQLQNQYEAKQRELEEHQKRSKAMSQPANTRKSVMENFLTQPQESKLRKLSVSFQLSPQ